MSQKKKKKKKQPCSLLDLDPKGKKIGRFSGTRGFWYPKTRKKETCQVTAQNVPGFSEDKTVYAVSNRRRKTTMIITG